MEPISLHVFADPCDIIEDLVSNSRVNLIEFILAIDDEVSDEGFTIELMSSIVKSLHSSNVEYVEMLAGKALEQTLIPHDHSTEFFSIRDYPEEWEKELKRQEILANVLKLLKEFDELE